MILRHRHRHAQEGVEGIRLPVASRAGQTRPELSLEHGMHKGIVASHMIRKRLGGDDVVGSAKRVLRMKKYELERVECYARFRKILIIKLNYFKRVISQSILK